MNYKIFLITMFSFLMVSPSVFASTCLPNFEIKKSEMVCMKDSECFRVGDACRSCGQPYYANKKFKSVIESRDTKIRAAAKCVLACEACAKWPAQGACNAGECEAPSIK